MTAEQTSAEPIFELSPGTAPLLMSFPHVGTRLLPGMADGMTAAGVAVADTDWVIDQAYPFLAELGVGTLKAQLSRYVLDLNRPDDDTPMYPGQGGTGLFPLETFQGAPIYRPGHEPDASARAARIATCWRPYHQALTAELARLKALHGYALLWEGHSIAPMLPRLFEGRLPDINLGTNSHTACPEAIGQALLNAATGNGRFSAVLNGRFKGGFITRHYGRPSERILAVQLELSQVTYLSDGGTALDNEKAKQIVPLLRQLVSVYLEEGRQWAAMT